MAFDNLDAQDKAICEALQAGKSDEEVMSEFGVGEDKIAQLRPVVEEAGDAPATEGAPATTEAPAGEATGDEPKPEGDAPAAEGSAEGEQA